MPDKPRSVNPTRKQLPEIIPIWARWWFISGVLVILIFLIAYRRRKGTP